MTLLASGANYTRSGIIAATSGDFDKRHPLTWLRAVVHRLVHRNLVKYDFLLLYIATR